MSRPNRDRKKKRLGTQGRGDSSKKKKMQIKRFFFGKIVRRMRRPSNPLKKCVEKEEAPGLYTPPYNPACN